ncbi:MAG TPA: 50S ribosomal protein L29 [Candidatus Saccharimonadales bacterium]|nr:50S ribosomal protein L29 [Candidatus Saccharimonadales bacterium]
MTELTQKNDTELTVLLGETRTQVAELAIETRTKQVANVKQAHALKRTVARILTLQRQRQLEVAAAVASVPEPTEVPKEDNHG